MKNFCRYKNTFGECNKGVHSYRILNLAAVDVGFTILFAYIITYISKTSFFLNSVLLFSLGIIMHKIFCVETTINKFIFLKNT
jgi:hypothetical protein